MTIRNWVKFFWHTLMVGGMTSAVVGFIVRWNEFSPLFSNMEIKEIFSVLMWLIGIGFTFSVISQMGYFAYLTIHQFGVKMFRSLSLWNAIQFVLIAVVLFDLVYFRFQAFADKGESIVPYLSLAAVLLIVGVIVAYLKAKQTNKQMFISALFFMVVVTVLEWLPVLQVNEKSWLYLMILTLLPCNAYQLLMLPKYTDMVGNETKNKSSVEQNKGKK
ncbi:KinB signaling pathway activation protein [Oikeobacillus pervagus]|uniref:KinB signaling pathway activation protein n=1 Tax=Oikeobacillus pervagus TaxID=1325931 RepID=A0AAJ1WHG3_9BACI|nr:KinB-signaling pathway activation protein [Oikeobacillus pervagus]MDQ0216167.1 KinB signaling pathway activation protein [Oikeobacillus pervagus]